MRSKKKKVIHNWVGRTSSNKRDKAICGAVAGKGKEDYITTITCPHCLSYAAKQGAK